MGLQQYIKQPGHSASFVFGTAVTVAFAAAVATGDPFSTHNTHRIPHIMTAIASIAGWGHFLHLLRGFEFVGVSILTLQRMLANDAVKFMTIYICFLLGGAQALYTELKDVEDVDNYWEVRAVCTLLVPPIFCHCTLLHVPPEN